MTITYKNRTYTVTEVATGELLKADLISRGFDGQTYMATGKNGAQFLIYKTQDGRWIA